MLSLVLLAMVCSCAKANHNEEAAKPTKIDPPTQTSIQPEQSSASLPIETKAQNDLSNVNNIIKSVQPEGLEVKKIIEDDLNHDGKKQSIVVFGEYERIFVVDENRVFGELMDPVGVVHDNIDVRIQKLDQSDTPFIVVYSEQASFGGYGEGFSIFRLNGDQIEAVNYNFPESTGNGSRKLEDYDNDGVFDSVTYEYVNDFQHHLLVYYQRYDGLGEGKTDLKYPNEQQTLVYPTEPKDLIRNFIEDFHNKEGLVEEMKQFVDNEAVLDFKVEDYIDLSLMNYGGLDLQIVESSALEPNKTFVVKAESQDNSELKFTLSKISDRWKISNIALKDN
ncbi:hypothetical protein [Cohnella mopanensis]|uniref:hypothetical protein n=1 Tax=Cohnella mopanensis TaxID=2911966 RepID=UPI001EF876A6|nr:hypothetical protein [Cohnella mopanensis]